jgi:hypothetical protein
VRDRLEVAAERIVVGEHRRHVELVVGVHGASFITRLPGLRCIKPD